VPGTEPVAQHRTDIEPCPGALLQSESFSLLIDSNLTASAAIRTSTPLISIAPDALGRPQVARIVAAARPSAQILGRDEANMEDVIRSRLILDGLGDLLREFPNLPFRSAILVGWRVPAPVPVELRELQEAVRPNPPVPACWKIWTGQQACDLDRRKIAGKRTHQSTRTRPDASGRVGSGETTVGKD
jgi:hypothetical protein